CKAESLITFAADNGVRLMTFDDEDEPHKIKRCAPNARVILRIFTDDPSSKLRPSQKFGTPLHTTSGLLQLAKSLGRDVAGFIFRAGSNSRELLVYPRSVADARLVYDEA
ncbi:uncharacterized protein BO97DRAFT_310078, partial [Aspergillus homomorphus CBS 101889]